MYMCTCSFDIIKPLHHFPSLASPSCSLLQSDWPKERRRAFASVLLPVEHSSRDSAGSQDAKAIKGVGGEGVRGEGMGGEESRPASVKAMR